MPRIRIQSYGPSASAKELARALGVKRLRLTNSRFRPRQSDIIINWGKPPTPLNCTYLNPLSSVAIATDKLSTLLVLAEAQLSIPAFSTTKPTEGKWVARTTLHGHSGQGIVVANAEDLPDAPLYTKYIRKDAEYRAIVVDTQVVDLKQKLKSTTWTAERKPYVWNSSNGYIYARENINPPADLVPLAIAATQALGLKYAAIDIIVKDNRSYVLEANTAFGLTNTTTTLVANAIRQLLP